jgi:glutathionylspermidine amidase/synthetase
MKSKYIKLLLIILIIVLAIIVYNFASRTYKFGDKIGTFDGVIVYSNQRDETNSSEPNYHNGLYTGLKWQCVEFVRRYLQVKRGITFSDVDSAFEIPNVQFTTLNGVLVHPTNELKVGSIIVWSKNLEDKYIDGHVAIVTSVTPTGVTVVEQNYIDNKFNRFIKINELKNTTIICLPE